MEVQILNAVHMMPRWRYTAGEVLQNSQVETWLRAAHWNGWRNPKGCKSPTRQERDALQQIHQNEQD